MAQLTFENPVYLWFLFVLPLFWLAHFYWLRHTKRKAMKFANFRVLKRITGRKLITRNYTLLAIRTLVLALAILAASQAIFWYEGETSENSFVLAIDTSASMRATDVAPSRLGAAKEYAVTFIESVDAETSFGVVSFSGVTFIEQTLTNDRNQLSTAINNIDAVEAGGTDIPGAIITGANLLAASDRGKAMLLITDGSNTLDTFIQDGIQQGIDYALEQKVIVHTIGIGQQSSPIGYLPEFYNISGVYDESSLIKISNATGGVYAQALNREEIISAYNTIAAESQIALIKRELAPPLMMLVLLLIILDWVLISTRFRTIP